MSKTKIAGVGMYAPETIITNKDLLKYMDTSDEWIQERTGIKERRFAYRTKETTTTMGVEASKIAIERRILTLSFSLLSHQTIIFPVVVYYCNGL